MLKKLLRYTVISASVAALAACGMQQGGGTGNMAQNGYRTNSVEARYGIHQNQHLRMNDTLANAIEKLDGVSKAKVLLSRTNAYVALELTERVRTNSALGGSDARLSNGAHDYGQQGTYYGAFDSRMLPPIPGLLDRPEKVNTPPAGTGALNTGMRGMYQTDTPETENSRGDGQIGGIRTYGGVPGRGRIGALNNKTRKHEASSMIDYGYGSRMEDGPGGGMSQLQAYYNNNGLSSQIRARVESVVRSLMPQIQNVYVSADNGFMKRMSSFTTGLSGKEVKEFNRYVDRLFTEDNNRIRNRYDMNDEDEQAKWRKLNGVNEQMNNSFDRNNPRHSAGKPNTAR